MAINPQIQQSNEQVEPVACIDEMCACRGGPCVSCPDGAYEKTIMDAQPKEPEQPEQEPVALEAVYETIIQWDEGGGKRSRRELARRIVSLYTNPPQRKPLTDDDLFKLWDEDPASDVPPTFPEFKHVARTIEAAHGIKE